MSVCLSGTHRRTRKRPGDCGGRLRACLSDRAWAKSPSFHLRPDLRRTLRSACRRGTIDQPIAIPALKRFVCKQSGPESRKEPGKEQFSFVSQKTSTRVCDDADELRHLLNFLASHNFPEAKRAITAALHAAFVPSRGDSKRGSANVYDRLDRHFSGCLELDLY